MHLQHLHLMHVWSVAGLCYERQQHQLKPARKRTIQETSGSIR